MARRLHRRLGLAAAASGLLALARAQLYDQRLCGEGKVISLPSDMKRNVRLLGNCTLQEGGELHSPGMRQRRIVLAHDSRLAVRGTTFIDIQLVVHAAKLEVDGAWFQSTEGMPRPNFGGAILALPGSEVHIVSSSFVNTSAFQGGGAISIGYLDVKDGVAGDCRLSVESCLFRETRVGSDGGAIFAMGCEVTVRNSTFEHTSALEFHNQTLWRDSLGPYGGGQCGGAISAFRSSLAVSDSNFVGGRALRGGSLYVTGIKAGVVFPKVPEAFLTVLDSSFVDSKAALGGVVFINAMRSHWDNIVVRWAKAKQQVDQDKQSDHMKKTFGGAFHTWYSPSLSISNALFQHVRSDGDGGAIYHIGDRISLSNLTLHDILAESNGGAVFIKVRLCQSVGCQRVVQLRQLTVQHARARSGAGLYIDSQASEAEREKQTGMNLRWDINASELLFRNVHSTDRSGAAVFLRGLPRAWLEGVTVEHATSAGHGGAVALMDVANATLVGVSTLNTSATQAGGAVFVSQSNLRVAQLEVHGAWARYGGALSAVFTSNITLNGLRLWTCYASEFGGGLAMDENSILNASDVHIEDAESADEGGAIWAHLSNASFFNLTVVGAVAAIQGGVIFASVGTLTVANSRFFSASPNFAELGQLKALTLRDLTLEGLEGRFLRILSSEVHELNVHGSCPPHTQLYGYDQESSQKNSIEFRCRKCDDDQGIQGLSTFDNRGKCMLCPAHSHGFASVGCICDVGYVDNNSDLSGGGARRAFPDCVSCKHMNLQCEGAVGLVMVCPPEDPKCKPVWPVHGFWRLDHRAEPPLKCPYGCACSRSRESMCAPGYEGPMCMVCLHRQYRLSHFLPCQSCVRNIVTLAVCVVMTLCAFGLAFAIRSERLRDRCRHAANAVGVHTSYLGNKARFAIFTMQAFSTFPMLKTRPMEVVNKATPTLNWFGCEGFASKAITVCLLGVGPYTRYVLMLLQIPLLFHLMRYFSVLINKDVNAVRLLGYNFMLMTIAKESFGFFVCNRVYSEYYLIGDYSIVCCGATFRCFQCLAGLVLVGWCGLLPGFVLLQMYKQRHKINPAVPGFIGYDANTTDGLSIGLKLVEDHEEVLSHYGRAAMTQAARVFERRHSPTEQDISNIRATAAECIRTRLNSRSLLKQGRRAVLEANDPQLQAFSHLYHPYHPDRWYYEFVNLFGRVGFAAIMVLPRWLQCLAGLMLAALLILSCLLQPFRRPSDTQVAATCYAAMGGIFVMEAVPTTTLDFRGWFSGTCLLLPLLSLVFFVGKAYVLPSRGGTWNMEAADGLFEEEFCRAYGLEATKPQESPAERDAG